MKENEEDKIKIKTLRTPRFIVYSCVRICVYAHVRSRVYVCLYLLRSMSRLKDLCSDLRCRLNHSACCKSPARATRNSLLSPVRQPTTAKLLVEDPRFKRYLSYSSSSVLLPVLLLRRPLPYCYYYTITTTTAIYRTLLRTPSISLPLYILLQLP